MATKRAEKSEAITRPCSRSRKRRGDGTPVRIDPDIASKARYLAAGRGVPPSELLSAYFRPAIERESRRASRELMTEGE